MDRQTCDRRTGASNSIWDRRTKSSNLTRGEVASNNVKSDIMITTIFYTTILLYTIIQHAMIKLRDLVNFH